MLDGLGRACGVRSCAAGHANAGADHYANPGTCVHLNTRANPYANAVANRHANARTDSHPDAGTDGHTNAFANRHANAVANRHAGARTDGHANAGADGHVDAGSNRYTNAGAYRHTDAGANRYANAGAAYFRTDLRICLSIDRIHQDGRQQRQWRVDRGWVCSDERARRLAVRNSACRIS